MNSVSFTDNVTICCLWCVSDTLCYCEMVWWWWWWSEWCVYLSLTVFACLGFLSPANRGSLMTCVLVLYVCLGTPAGYVSARIYKSKLTIVVVEVVVMVWLCCGLVVNFVLCNIVSILLYQSSNNGCRTSLNRRVKPMYMSDDIQFSQTVFIHHINLEWH